MPVVIPILPALPVIAPSSHIAQIARNMHWIEIKDRNPPGQVPGDRGKQERPRDSLPQQGCGGFLVLATAG